MKSEFNDLTLLEKSAIVGELVHAMQKSQISYDSAKEIIELARLQGHFTGVSFPNPTIFEHHE